MIFGSCKKEETAKVVEAVDQAVDEVVSLGEAASAEERAAKLGFVAHLSSDTEMVMALYDGKGMVRNLRDLDLWKFIIDVAEEEEGMNPEEEIAPQAEMVGQFLGNEIFLATGKGTVEQTKSLQILNAKVGYYQFRTMSRALAEGVSSGDMETALMSMNDSETWLMDLVSDIGEYTPLIEGAEMPPVLAGIKVSDKEAMAMAEEQISQAFGSVPPEMGEAIEFEKASASFKGFLLKGETLVEAMEADRSEMDKTIGKEHADQILTSLQTKNLVIATGKLDDYLLVYIGGSVEACPIAESLETSLAANDAISFVDAHLDHPVHGFLFGSNNLMEALDAGGLEEIAAGIRDGVSSAEGVGDERELVAMLDMIGEREDALLELVDASTFGGLITIDGGARFDLFGGVDNGAIDYAADHKLASLGEGDRVLMFANWASDEEYSKRAGDLMKVVVESAYALTGKLMEADIEEGDLAQFKQGFEAFDQLFRDDFLKFYDGLSTAADGLGEEAALVVDLNAAVPPFPGVPQELVEGGRFVRASLVAPVTDRSKLADAWKEVDLSLRAMFKSAKELGSPDINMLVPTSSEKDDVITWYFDAAAFSDDVKPSVTLNDEWFVASTSRTQALDLIGRAGAEAKAARKGAWFELDLDTLREFTDEMISLVEDNAEVILGNDAEDFAEELPRIRAGLKALQQFDGITLHDRKVNGARQISLHFQTR
ncbi:hypothetical protein [Haloferula chungangensis]|uniref:hypothetical protein n=1 Tax=Haloferula chungangensis TaxID=1048331 RepID=UPI0036D37C37